MMRFECEFQGATSDSTLIGYEFSGKRITRGTHRSATGIVVSADIQAAGNILRKVAVQLGISFVEAGKAALTLPKRYDLHLMRRVYRKNGDKGTCPHVAASAHLGITFYNPAISIVGEVKGYKVNSPLN